MLAYAGGKIRTAKHVVPILKKLRKSGQLYFEPFAGMGSIGLHMENPRLFNDIDPDVCAIWRGAIAGFTPSHYAPNKELYNRLRRRAPKRPGFQEAFNRIACCYGGYKGTSYCPGNYPHGVKRFNKMKEKAVGARISWHDYRHIKPRNCLIYCDPPYENSTLKYSGNRFRTDEFWELMREWSKDNIVVISERQFPDDFRVILKTPIYRTMASTGREAARDHDYYVVHESRFEEINKILSN